MAYNYNSNHRAVLTLDDIARKAPSVFATHPAAKVSDKYEFIPTSAILTSLLANGWKCVDARQTRANKFEKVGFQRHELRFTRDDLTLSDGSSVDMLVRNSHDTSEAAIMSAAFWRKICANGLHVSADLVEPIRVKHIGSKAHDFIEASYRLIDSVPLITQSVQEMQAILLSPEERIALANASLIAKYGTEKGLDASGCPVLSPIRADRALAPRRSFDLSNDLWTTFNVIQENLVEGGQRGINRTTGRRLSTRAVNSITESSKLNQALWSLAESMKAHKAA